MKKRMNSEAQEQPQEAFIPVPEIHLYGRNAVVYIEDEICPDLINPIVHYIIQENVDPTVDEITLFIDSPGGDLCSAWKLIDLMAISRIPIRTVGIGGVMSAALLIMMAGHIRMVSINTEVMSHQPTFNASSMSAQLRDFDSMSAMFGKTFTRIVDFYKKHTGLSEDKLKEVLLGASDEWLTAEEAVSYGFADHIVQDFGTDFWKLFEPLEFEDDEDEPTEAQTPEPAPVA